jgi:hypothetical protein
MQAIDMLFDVDLKQHSSYKLSAMDWEILEGMESILSVSFYMVATLSTEYRTQFRSLMISNKRCLLRQRRWYRAP